MPQQWQELLQRAGMSDQDLVVQGGAALPSD